MERGLVGITTNEKDIVPVYGNRFDDDLERHASYSTAISNLRYLYEDINDLRKRYISLGFHLCEYDRNSLYMFLGFDNIYEFAEANLGMDKTSVSRCIAVAKRFSKSSPNPLSSSPTMFLDDRYKDFSYSQLCEMVSMDEKDCRRVKPEMTIKQIRDLKKRIKAGAAAIKEHDGSDDNVPAESVATSQQKEKKLFDYGKYINLRGAAQSAYIKSCDPHPKKSLVALHVFDCNGESVFPDISNRWLDVIYYSNSCYYIRLKKTKEELEDRG